MFLGTIIDPHWKLQPLPSIMSDVVYFELGTHYLQVIPRARLVPYSNYVQVVRPWASVNFDLIDVGANGDFMTRPAPQLIERGNRYIVTLHWDDRIPRHLRYERSFLVGPMNQCGNPLPLC